jgi:hypothetical protein
MATETLLSRVGQLENNESDFLSWYGNWATTTGLNSNPYDWRHYYDYRKAYEEGVSPQIGTDGEYHWDSKFKHDLHPNRFINIGESLWWDSKYGKPVSNKEVTSQKVNRLLHELDYLKIENEKLKPNNWMKEFR